MHKFYRSRAAGSVEVTPMFFYHLPKCAGMSLHTVAAHALNAVNWLTNTRRLYVARLDAPGDFSLLPPPPYAFLSSHLPYGAHLKAKGDPKLITFLRDPIGRVVSSYTYRNMRDAAMRGDADFVDFFRREENRNVMTKTLAGSEAGEAGSAAMVERAVANLERHFFAFARSARMDEFIEYYLRSAGLFNAISDNINVTSREYRLDADKFGDEMRRLNALDAELFEFVARNERMPTFGDDGSANQTTLVIFQLAMEDKMLAKALPVTTGQMQEKGVLGADYSLNEAAIESFVAALRRAEQGSG